MYALKLELKLNNSELTIMARHAGYARFCYNLARTLYLGVMDIKVSIVAITEICFHNSEAWKLLPTFILI